LILRDTRRQIPYATEQGNTSGEQGDKIDDQRIKSAEQGVALMRTYRQESGFCRAIFGARHPSISTLSATTRTRPSAIRHTVIG